ncbi:MAG: T9SS type A sorting domain-containing protein [Bacteroidales bacterium]|nr:T9SS type A sorting domain-containing protein [Bacteroidales bacterium]
MLKKIILITIIAFLSFGAFSQSTQLDFSMQLQNTNNHEALIYPNPIQNLNFKVKSYSIITDVVVMDMVGKFITSKHLDSYANEEIMINMPHCEKGVYMVKITFDDGETIIKKLLYQ